MAHWHAESNTQQRRYRTVARPWKGDASGDSDPPPIRFTGRTTNPPVLYTDLYITAAQTLTQTAMSADPEQEAPDFDDPEPDFDDGIMTDSSKARFSYTNDLLAMLLIGFAIAACAYLITTGNDVPMWLSSVTALGILSAVIWAFGKGVVKEARKMVNGGSND